MLYITVSKDREENYYGNRYVRLWISENLEEIKDKIDEDKEERLTYIVGVENKNLPKIVADDFIEEYKELPYIGCIKNGDVMEQMCFRNADSDYVVKCVEEYFLDKN